MCVGVGGGGNLIGDTDIVCLFLMNSLNVIDLSPRFKIVSR